MMQTTRLLVPAVLLAALWLAGSVTAQETVSFPSADGGIVFGDLRGDGNHAVVLVHGARFTKESWTEQAEAIRARGMVTLAIDLRGRGRSRGGPGGETDDELVHHDVVGAVRYLQERGAERISLVGGSWGGWAAANAATELPPGTIDGLVLLAASSIEHPERLHGRKLFITTRDDFMGSGTLRLPFIREQFERAPEPKELVVLEGSAHAQHVFATAQGPRLLRAIIDFLTSGADDPAGRLIDLAPVRTDGIVRRDIAPEARG